MWHEIIVENSSLPTRLDRYLRIIYPGLTQGIIEKSLRQRLIRFGGKKAQASTRVIDGDILTIHNSIVKATGQSLGQEGDVNGEKVVTASDKALAAKLLTEFLIFEDEFFYVINKPASISSQSGTNIAYSIDSAIQYINQANQYNSSNALKLVHRLDKETSGIFLIAKGRINASLLANAFKTRVIEKQYLAILCGVPDKLSGRITAKLKKDIGNQKQIIAEDGDEAVTEYRILASNAQYSLALFTPHTGRTHQLRVHALSLGCPIYGDGKYGVAGENLFLHAAAIKIPSTVFVSQYSIFCPIPKHFSTKLFHEFQISDFPKSYLTDL